ncbi:TerB family tellurite resistance protein [Robiginitalea aurantiaca]|uniref:TerB family tellurite resistance protein n=1 Tax=Robiginitalea aurantiaca TaxID=3056915 RepID=A0ABT7WDA8_9FLAO|nr:TerB family tellurite resistance protein [Robiginitalea aurantiaca]MDM9630903.1 TerB family tellurite resistance protein [Robiginitalea aurantiaca]
MGLSDLFNSYDKKKRRSHFKNLFSVARADGDVDRAEMDLVIGLAEKFHMSTDEVTRIIRNPEDVALFTPKTAEERMEHLYDLISVMMVDGRIDEKELFLCKSLAMKLGCSDKTIDSLLRDLIEEAIKGNAAEKAVERLLLKYA